MSRFKKHKQCDDCPFNNEDKERKYLSPYYDYGTLMICPECAKELGKVDEVGSCRYCKYPSKTKKQSKVEYDMIMHGEVILCKSCAKILGLANEERD